MPGVELYGPGGGQGGPVWEAITTLSAQIQALSLGATPLDGTVTDAKVAAGAAIAQAKIAGLVAQLAALVGADNAEAIARAAADTTLTTNVAANATAVNAETARATAAEAGKQATIPAGTYADIRRIDTAWRPGRQWVTRFQSQAADQLIFDATSVAWTTNNGKPCITTTNSSANAQFTLKPSIGSLANVEVLLRYRVQSDATYALGSASIRALARFLDFANFMDSQDNWATASPGLFFHSVALGVDDAAVAVARPIDKTDTTKERYLRLRVVGDVMYAKNWFADADEPDNWQFVRRTRPASASSAPILTTDNVEIGVAGILLTYGATFVYQLSITELLPASTNVVINPGLIDFETGVATPASWFCDLTGLTGTTADVVAVPDRFGVTRNALRIVKPTAQGGGPLWKQRLWNQSNPGANAAWPRLAPHPRMHVPAAVEVRIWSKGTDVINPTPSGLNLGAVIDNYYYDFAGSAANMSPLDGSYFRGIGPNVSGSGTWDWTETVFVMPIHRPNSISFFDLAFGLHDAGSAGTLLLMDPQLRPLYSV